MRLAPSTPWFTILLGVCAGLPALSIDLSAPTLTVLPVALGTTAATAGLSLSLFMVGFALGQFVGGRGSDLAGRRPVLLISISVYVLSGICCFLATTGVGLVAARLVQGVGAGACAVQATAMVQDLFEGEAARRKQSYVSVVLMIMPMLAPALGTFLIAHWGWRSVHMALAIGGAALAAIIILAVDETRAPLKRSWTQGFGITESRAILKDTVFCRVTLVNALSYGAIFAYVAGAPVVVIDDFGQPPVVYAVLFAATAVALSSGAVTNVLLGRRGISGERVVWPGLAGQAASTLALIAVGAHPSDDAAIVIVSALLVGSFTRGLLSPNLIHLAVSRHRDHAGLASALVGLAQLLVGALTSIMVATLIAHLGYAAVSFSMAVPACAAAFVWRVTEGADRLGQIRRANR